MSMIVAARFPTFEDSARAVRQLALAGFPDEDIHTFYVNTPGAHGAFPLGGDRYADPDARGGPLGAVAGAALLGLVLAVAGGWVASRFGAAAYVALTGAGVGAYIGALIGALWLTGRRRRGGHASQQVPQHPPVRPAGVMLAVHVQAGREAQAGSVLKAAGGEDVERAQGRWQDGKWVDFDPLTPPGQAQPGTRASAAP